MKDEIAWAEDLVSKIDASDSPTYTLTLEKSKLRTIIRNHVFILRDIEKGLSYGRKS